MANAAEARRIPDNLESQHNPGTDFAAQRGQSRREFRQDGIEAGWQTAPLMTQAARRAMEQGQQAMEVGWRSLAQAQAPLAEAGLEQTRRVTETAARVTDIYREASERTTEDIQALLRCAGVLGRGFQRWQHACMDLVQQSTGRAADKRRMLFHASSPTELAEAQRDFFIDVVNHMFTASTALFQLAAQIAQDAIRPLQERSRSGGD